MKNAIFAGAVAAIASVGAAHAAVAPGGAGLDTRPSADAPMTEMAQGAGSELPPNQRCPQQPPSHRQIQNPYVIWICQKPGGTQFDYYLGAGYLFSVIAPN